jgi:hypothetical protein
VPLAASPISVQSSDLPDGPDNAQNNWTGDPGLAEPLTAQLGTVVPVQVTVLQLLVRLIVTNPPAVPTGALPTVYEPRREQLDAAPVPGAP